MGLTVIVYPYRMMNARDAQKPLRPTKLLKKSTMPHWIIADSIDHVHYILYSLLEKALFKRDSAELNSRWNVDPPLHAKYESAVQTVDDSSWKCAKESENGYICRKSHGYNFLGFSWYDAYNLKEGNTITGVHHASLLDKLKAIQAKRPRERA